MSSPNKRQQGRSPNQRKQRTQDMDFGMQNTNQGPYQHPIHTMVRPDYTEAPRANLQSIIQKMREGNKGFKHVILAGKIMEKELGKKSVEPVIREFYNSIIDPEEDPDRAKPFQARVSGICCIASPLYLHYMEIEEDRYFDLVMQAIHESCGKHIHENAWILHFAEEEPEQCIGEWHTKTVNANSTNVKDMTQFDKVNYIYMNLQYLSRDCQKLLNQGKNIADSIQKYAADNLPFGEELYSCLDSKTRTIEDFMLFLAPPDILLEKELAWPVDPQLIY